MVVSYLGRFCRVAEALRPVEVDPKATSAN